MKNISKTILSTALSVIIASSSCISAFAQCDDVKIPNPIDEISVAKVTDPIVNTTVDPMDEFRGDYSLWSMGNIVEVDSSILPTYITNISDTSFAVFLSTVLGLSIFQDSSYKENRIKAGVKAGLLAGFTATFKTILSSHSTYYVETIISRKDLGNGTYDYWILTYAYSDPNGTNILRYTEQHVTA